MKGRVLIIAGSDSGGGAGIQADIKTVTALNAYAATAITALTAQNTMGVFGVHPVPIAFIRQQIDLVLDDIGADAIKTGMLHSAEVIETVARAIREKASNVPLVVDPVMVAKGGASLLDPSATGALRQHLLPLAAIITPNAPEAAELLGAPVDTLAALEQAALALSKLGPKAVLVKGGHVAGDIVRDVLCADGTVQIFDSPRIASTSTHGTGCTLASAIAASLAQGLSMRDSVVRARAYVQEAIRTAPGYGKGHGPLNHAHTVKIL
jgi:hydroxymethylpyrimidine/phosphomethylpyrimidine kinase